MKRIIRKGVFETNSSSAHSLSLAREDQEFVLDTIYPDQNGVINVVGDEFGWSWNAINDSMMKLAYAFQDSPDHQHDSIKEVVMKQTGAIEVNFDEGDGYIDHEGIGTTHDIRGDSEKMRNFIFNKNSWLFTGNDNTEPAPTFYHVPEYKDGRQILPEYKYELKIDGLKDTMKYLTAPDEDEIGTGIDSLLGDAYLTERGDFLFDNSISWQVSRPRNKFYRKNYSIDQDYAKKEILFLKENDERFYDIGRKIDADPEMKKLNYWEKNKIKTDRARAMGDLVKAVSFTITEL